MTLLSETYEMMGELSLRDTMKGMRFRHIVTKHRTMRFHVCLGFSNFIINYFNNKVFSLKQK